LFINRTHSDAKGGDRFGEKARPGDAAETSPGLCATRNDGKKDQYGREPPVIMESRFQGKVGPDMRYVAVALLAVAIVFGTTAAAQTPDSRDGRFRPDPPRMIEQVVGEVTSIDGKEFVVTATVHGRSLELVLTFNAATRFSTETQETTGRGRSVRERVEEVTSADLQVGDEVTVSYDLLDRIAQTVLITSAPASYD
jgi:hypothetical protein